MPLFSQSKVNIILNIPLEWISNLLPYQFPINSYLVEIETHCRNSFNAYPSIYSEEEVRSGEELLSLLLNQIFELFSELFASNLPLLISKTQNDSLHSFAFELMQTYKVFPPQNLALSKFYEFTLELPKLISSISIPKNITSTELEVILLSLDFLLNSSISLYQTRYRFGAESERKSNIRLFSSLIKCTYISFLVEYISSIVNGLSSKQLEALKKKNWNHSVECLSFFVISNAIHLIFLNDSSLIKNFYKQHIKDATIIEYLLYAIPSLRKNSPQLTYIRRPY